MHRISRIYVGNYGHKMCWYDGLLFNFMDEEAKEPNDCILQLENGGGKSTLLAGLFSCFDTSQNRFLKHIQNNKNRFSDYFSPDGLPGFILFEWMIPVPGSQQQRKIITGQVASVKNRFTSETERLFFSFETAPDLALESIPAPKLCADPCVSMDDFTRWLSRMKREYKGNIFDTRNQSEWEQHLQNERGIDVGMLKLQLEFSRMEGSIDTVFLNFRNETEFLQKFLYLTMDPEQAEIVRKSVITACDKLKRKPEFENRLNILSELLERLQSFEAEASKMNQAKEEHAKCDFDCARFAAALFHGAKEQVAQAEVCNSQIIETKEVIKRNSEKRSELIVIKDGLTFQTLRNSQRQAQNDQDDAERAHKSVQEHINYLNAAKQFELIEALKTESRELLATVQLAEQGLQPFRERAATQGKIYKDVVEQHELKVTADASNFRKLAQEARLRRDSLKKQSEEFAIRMRNEERDLTTLEDEQKRYENALSNWVCKGVLAEGETISSGLERFTVKINTTQELMATLENRIKEAQDAIKSLSTKLARERESIVEKEESHRTLLKEVAKAEALREIISQDQSLCRAAQLEIVDPDSESLPNLIEKYIRDLQKTRDSFAVNIAKLKVDRMEIESTGLAGADHDVQKLVAALSEIGIKSAGAFNLYVANTERNGTRARDLVCSNPAKFLGVAVKTEKDLENARTILKTGVSLTKPVMISLIANESELPKNGFVVPAENDAAYNFDSAKNYALELDERLFLLNNSYAEYNRLATEAIQSKSKLSEYSNEYGGNFIREKRSQIADLELELSELQASIKQLTHDLEKLDQSKEQAEKQLKATITELGCLTTERQLLERDHADLEMDLTTRTNDISLVRKRLAGLYEQSSEVAELIEQSFEQAKTLEQAEHESNRQASELKLQKNNIRYCDNEFDTSATIAAGITLANARESYESAASNLDYKEKDQLGVLKTNLENVEKQLSVRNKEYQSEFSGLIEDKVRSLIFLDIPSELRKSKSDLELAEQKKLEFIKLKALCDNELKAFRKKQPNAEKLSVEYEGLSQEELSERLAKIPDEISQCERKLEELEAALRSFAEQLQSLQSNAELLETSASQLKESVEDETDFEPNPTLLPSDLKQIKTIISTLIKAKKEARKKFDHSKLSADSSFMKLQKSMGRQELAESEPEIALQLNLHGFEEACASAARLCKGVADRVVVAQSMLDSLKTDFDATVNELSNLVLEGIRIMNSACNKRLPDSAPYLGGKPVIRMKANLSALNAEHKKQVLEDFMDGIIKSGFPHKNGTDMVADAIQKIAGKNLGIQIAKLIREETEQYASADKLSNSGGEAVSMALFLYILTAQIRAETHADRARQPGGPLILDNPFAKASSPFIWRAQRAFARSMGVQLIFATATKDVETLAEFEHFICLRKAGQNNKTGRYHIEQVDLSLVRRS